ncbi:MAG: hypothetical protein ABIP81_07725 [Terriglobales bacterium]
MRNAVDCIAPAFDRTRMVMFRPYQWKRWWRIALVGMATAVIGTANGCNLGGLADFKEAFSRDPKAAELLTKLQSMVPPSQIAFLLTVLVVGVTLLAFVHIYVNSVARFMMFDLMTTGAVRIRAGWAKWNASGLKLFGLQILLGIFATAILSGIGYLFTAGARSDDSPGPVLAAFFALMAATWLFSIVVVVFHVVSTDFAVPIMALEGVSLAEALRRVWRMVAEMPVDFLVYLLMKLVLVIAVSIAMLIIQIVLLIIPLVILFVIMAVIIGAIAGGTNPLAMVALIITGAIVCAALILFLVAMIAAPTYVFFQGYALEFFSDRYPRLRAALYPAPPAPTIPPPLPLPAM